MKMTFKPNKASVLLLSLCALLAGCESKEEKEARIQQEAVTAELDKAEADNKEVDKLFADVKRTAVDLSEPVMAQLRASLPEQSVVFEDETAEMTAAGDGAVSACSTAVSEKTRSEHCLGKVVRARGTVGPVFSDGFELAIKGVALGVATTPDDVRLKTNDLVLVRGTVAENYANGYILLKESSIEKLPVASNPLQERLTSALTLARLCFAAGTLSSTLSAAPGELPADVGDIATDKDDPRGGAVTVMAFGQKIDGDMVPHLRRCAIRNGKVVGDQVRAGKIVDRKAIFADASGKWESEKVLTARVSKANDAQWHVDRAKDREREKENAVAEQTIMLTLGRIKRAPESTEQALAAADCLIALGKAERSEANWGDARDYCRAKAAGVPGIQPE